MARLDPTGVSRILSYIKNWVTAALGGKANSSHSHTTSQITDFPSFGTTSGTICEGNDSRLSGISNSDIDDIADDAGFSSGSLPASEDIFITGDIIPNTDNSVDVGASSKNIKMIYTKGITINGTQFLPSDIPTKTSDLTNDSGYITSSGSCNYANSAGSCSSSTYSTYLNSLGAQTPKSGRDIFHSGVYTYTTYTDTNTPAHYGAVIGYGNGQGGSCEMFAEWVGSGQLWFRVLRDWQDSWTSWEKINTESNTVLNGYRIYVG